MKHTPSSLKGSIFLAAAAGLVGAIGLTPKIQAQDLLLQYKESIQFYNNYSELRGFTRVGSLDLVTFDGDGLVILENTDPKLLKPIGAYLDNTMQPNGIAANDSIAIIGDSSSGIHILDISDPGNPTLITTFGSWDAVVPLETVFDVWINGNYCFVLGSQEIYVVDISTPSTPSIVGTLSHTFPYGSTPAAQAGDKLIFAAGDSGVQVLDFSNPASPSVIGSLIIQDQFALSIVLDGSTAYVGHGSGVEIVDVTNPSNPVSVGSMFDDLGHVGLAKVGDALYLIGFEGVRVADVSDPTQARVLGPVANATGQFVEASSVGDTWMLLRDSGYYLFDAEDEFAPKLQSRFEQGMAMTGMAEAGDDLAFVLGFRGIGIGEISETFPPYVEQLTETGGFMGDVVANATHAYVAAGSRGLQVFSISDPKAPSLIETFPLSGFAWGVDLVGTTVYVAIDDQGIVAIDATTPDTLVLLDSLALPGNAMDVTAAGNSAYVSCFEAGVQVVDISNANQLALLGGFDTDGRSHHSQLSGNTLYVADGLRGVVVLDVSDPSTPSLISRVGTKMELIDIAVDLEGRMVLSSGDFSVLEILDLSDPVRPVIHPTNHYLNMAFAVSRWINGCFYLGESSIEAYRLESNPVFESVFSYPGFASGMPSRSACDGSFLYLAGGFAGLVIFDIADPGEPVFASHYLGGDFYSYGDVVLHAGYAYMVGNTGIEIVDVSNPYFPVLAGSIPVELGATAFSIHNGLAYVSAEFSGVEIYDLSDPVSPVFVGKFDYQDSNITGMEFLLDYGYFCAGYGGMIVMDLSDPSNPVPIFTDDFEEGVWDVQLEGQVLYVSTDSAVKVVSVQNPQLPIVIAPAEIYGFQNQLHVVGTTAYTADGVHGMVVVDAAVPASPQIVSTTPIQGGGAMGISVCGNFAYVTAGTQLHVFDVSTLSTPSQVKSIPISAGYEHVVIAGDVMVAGGDSVNSSAAVSVFVRENGEWKYSSLITAESPRAMQLVGNVLYMASYGRIYVYDLADPANPSLLSSFEVRGAGGVNAIVVAANHLYVASNDGVYIYGVMDPANLVPKGSWNSSGTLSDIVVSGNYAYVADSFNGLQVLDVSDPLVPVPETLVQLEIGELYHLSIEADRLLVMSGSAAVLMDISDPTMPTQVGVPFYSSIGGITDGVLEGDTVFFASGGGIESMNVSDTSGFVPQIGSYVAGPQLMTIVRDNGEVYAGGLGLRVLRDVLVEPTMSIRLDGVSLEINWAPVGGGFQLEYRPSPGEGQWETLPFAQPPHIENPNQLRRIYRLRR